MTIDLDSLSRQELTRLRNDVDRAIATLADREKRRAIDAAERAVAEYGFKLEELTGIALPKGRGRKAPSAVKYRNTANPAQTWSGRGRRPEWINAALAEGKSLNDFLA
ncbi:MAG: H-NS histone family protein [Rubellimicrobium sp.]|nr:H-NS histone family protein [Rubellimicrobium sp.]